MNRKQILIIVAVMKRDALTLFFRAVDLIKKDSVLDPTKWAGLGEKVEAKPRKLNAPLLWELFFCISKALHLSKYTG